jgi:hypothetical protein
MISGKGQLVARILPPIVISLGLTLILMSSVSDIFLSSGLCYIIDLREELG